MGSGHRWPRKETFALLEIRLSLDANFRDSSAKAPLWEEVSGKMGELGFSRSSKKCKEKFENIYKYHKRTKDVRSEKANGKAYLFFEQLEALDQQPLQYSLPEIGVEVCPSNVILDAIPCSVHKPNGNSADYSTTLSTSSSSSQESEGTSKKKMKLTHFFEKLMKKVAERQEGLRRAFVEALEKCEKDRITREESWKAQESARMKRETELLVRERSATAAKDAALLAFLKKFSVQCNGVRLPETFIPDLENELAKYEKGCSIGSGSIMEKVVLDKQEIFSDNGLIQMPSRWPKEEVDALIRIRTSLDSQYQDNGLKGSLWEEVSLSMEKLGCTRSAKRCKEKWENINKYFKRVKDSNRKRQVDSKTCSYFHQLDALYSNKKAKSVDIDSDYDMRPEELLMHMMGGHEERADEGDYGRNENVDDGDKKDGELKMGD